MRSRRVSRALWWALLLSLLVHLLLAGRLPAWVWDAPSMPHLPIQVELSPLAPAVPPPAPARPAPLPQPLPSVPETQPPAAPLEPVAHVPMPVPEDVPLAPVVSSEPEPLPPLQEEQLAATEAVPEAVPPLESTIPDEPPQPSPPSHVEIEFEVIRKGGVAAVEKQTFVAREDGTYRLESLARPKGLLALALSELRQSSEGRVTAAGLRPERYRYQYGDDAARSRLASFDWESGTLLLEYGKRRKTAPLQSGAQDLLSFMYQFMYVPPLQEMQLAITNGRHFRSYAYVFEGEQTLETKAGALQCYKISRNDLNDDEALELWLAAERHFLPVRIRMTDEDGVVTDRIVTRLQLE